MKGLCKIDEPRRLLPLVHVLVTFSVQIILYVSFYFYRTGKLPIPQYLVDSSILSTFEDEGLRVAEVISASIGFVLILDTALEIVIYFVQPKKCEKRSSGERLWPSDSFLDNLKDWSFRLLFTSAIVIPPMVLLNAPPEVSKIVYAFGLRTFQYTVIISAVLIPISDTIDRTWRQFALSISLNLTFSISDLSYFFYSCQERSSYQTLMMTVLAGFRIAVLCAIAFRAVSYYIKIFRSLCKNGELRLRRLSWAEWRFVVYTGMLIISFILLMSVGASKALTTNTPPRDQIQVIVISTAVTVTIAMLPLARSRYEVARAQVRLGTVNIANNTQFVAVVRRHKT